MKRYLTFWNVVGVVVLLLGLLVFFYSSPNRHSAVVNLPQNVELPEEPQEVELRLYFAKPDASAFLVERRTVMLEPGESVYQRALDELVKGPGRTGAPLVPEGTPAPTVFVRDRVAYVDLPGAYAQLGYGTTGETLLVYGMAYTLLDLKPIEEVRYLLEGEPAVTLGHLSLVEPVRRRR